MRNTWVISMTRIVDDSEEIEMTFKNGQKKGFNVIEEYTKGCKEGRKKDR